jgi:hypothetical protein
MNKTLGTILIVIAVLVVAGGLFFIGTMYGRTQAFGIASWNNPPRGSYAVGPGMMGDRRGYGMMDGGRGYGMMDGTAYGNSDITPLSVDQARAAAQKYLTALNNPDLAVTEVMIFDNNAYVAVKETSTGLGAFELLVDPTSQVAYPEHGPNMMWNLKYGGINHAGMGNGRGYHMGAWSGQSATPPDVSAAMPVTVDQATKAAQSYLDAQVLGATAAKDPLEFYGYYTLDFTKDGKVAGMLSVNGYNSQVFLHTWHGTFIEEAE